MIFGTKIIDEYQFIKPKFLAFESRADLSQATFAGGCFWCMQAPFEQLPGVKAAIVGYISQVREAVKVYYQSSQVSFDQLLDTFWLFVDPTDPSGQFFDRGPAYQSAIFFSNPQEQQLAEASKLKLEKSGRFTQPIVTSIMPMAAFSPAPDYHQDFYKHSPKRYQAFSQGSGRKDFVEQAKTWQRAHP